MSQNVQDNNSNQPRSNASNEAALASVRASVHQLIANGKAKTALDHARDLHKAQGSPASEALLIEAYAARIESLFTQNLTVEAASLMATVAERFPAAKPVLDALQARSSARAGELTGLVAPLNDPNLPPERRAAIEEFLQNELTDPASLAQCAALSAGHPLRIAVPAIEQAFRAVTSGPVSDEQIALNEVSRRSPLASWKLLIRAIACFYRAEDAGCREYLGAIKPESAPARAVPVIRAMLGEKITLSPAADALAARVVLKLRVLRNLLETVDRAGAEGQHNRFFKAVREAADECRRSAPDLLEDLRQAIAIRCGIAGFDANRAASAMGGAPRADAAFLRASAVAAESTGDPYDVAEACELWEDFHQQAVREKWFCEKSMETAAIYRHMASLLADLNPHELHGIRKARLERSRRGPEPDSTGDLWFLSPDELYQRACLIDPHAEVFQQWMKWAETTGRAKAAEKVARVWHSSCPGEIEPLLYLMKESEKRRAIPTALTWLDKAECIDAVHTSVRSARLRLLAAGAMRHIEQKKPHLALEKLAALTLLPQSQQGDRPAGLEALRYVIACAARREPDPPDPRVETARLLGSEVAAQLLIWVLVSTSKSRVSVPLPPAGRIGKAENAALPASVARVVALVKDFGFTRFALPTDYLSETERRLPAAVSSMDGNSLMVLSDLGLSMEAHRLSWIASTEGLNREGPACARFLLLRGIALPPGSPERRAACIAAAVELARLRQDPEIVSKGIELLRNPMGGKPISVTIEQAHEVLRREKAAPDFPRGFGDGPDYSDIVAFERQCMCPDCVRKRDGDLASDLEDPDSPLDDGRMEELFNSKVPPGMPPELAKLMFKVLKEAYLNGESPEEAITELLEPPSRRSGKRKGRSK